MNYRTSETHPLRLDVLPSGLLPAPGRLRLTFAPGKKAPGLDGFWRRDLRMDLRRLREVYDVGVTVSLLDEHELKTLGIEDYQEEIRGFRTLELRTFPIPDGGVPRDVDEVRALVGWILERLGDGKHVAVHCRGGLGRSGLVAACCLVGVGVAPDAAIREVRLVRPGAIETPAQEAFVENFSRHGVARRDSWKIKPMPKARARLDVSAQFTRGKLLHLRLGRVPGEMEEKWFAFVEGDWIYLHRSWTGFCIYAARLELRGDVHQIVEAWVNRDTNQYQGKDDEEDQQMLVNLIHAVMLGRPW